jgi:hypothetical protein
MSCVGEDEGEDEVKMRVNMRSEDEEQARG